MRTRPALHAAARSMAAYAGIFALLMLGIIAIPVPVEPLLLSSGYLIYSGRLNAAGAFTAALLGTIGGVTVSYWIGRKFGTRVPHHKLQKTEYWYRRVGHWTLFIGYYIPGVRHFPALIAGAARLDYRRFALYAYSGALVWVAVFLILGYAAAGKVR